jgi:hypothetical protein
MENVIEKWEMSWGNGEMGKWGILVMGHSKMEMGNKDG